jgi:hypothetical protein
MPSETHSDQRAASGREPIKNLPSSKPPAPQNGPPIFHGGLETPRSSDC